VTVYATLFALSALAILIGVVWRNPIVEQNGQTSLFWFTLFIAAPAAILCTQALFFTRARVRDRDFSPRLKTVMVGICTAAPAVIVAALYMDVLDPGRMIMAAALSGLGLTLPDWLATPLMYVLYLVVPIVLPFLGGAGAAWLVRNRRITREDIVFNLERLTVFQLGEAARMMNLKAAAPDRMQLIDEILKKTKADRDWGRLEKSIRQVNPDAFN
jgi:hypothetical protein